MPHTLYEDTNPDEQRAAFVLQQQFAELDLLVARVDAIHVASGSLLEVDDRQTAYDPISHQVHFLLGAATDYLLTLRRTVEDHGMPMVAAYPLIRGAIEACAQVLWLTTGGTRSKRVFRALHRVWDMARFRDLALGHLIADQESHLPRLRARLDELLAAAGAGQRSLDQNYPAMTDIVIEAGRHVSGGTLRPVDVWRLCSSMAHANSSIALAILESREEGPRDALGSSYVMTTSFQTIAAFVAVCISTANSGLDALDRLNAT